MEAETVGCKADTRANRRAALVRCLSSSPTWVRILTLIDEYRNLEFHKNYIKIVKNQNVSKIRSITLIIVNKKYN